MLRIGWGEAEVSETIGAADRRGRRVVEGRVVGSETVRAVAVDEVEAGLLQSRIERRLMIEEARAPQPG